MCDTYANEVYSDEWEAYFTFVNTEVYSKLKFEDELYIAYGSYHKLPVEDVKHWYKDAEESFITSQSLDSYLTKKYDEYILSEDDLDYFYEREIHTYGTVFENMGYWFET